MILIWVLLFACGTPVPNPSRGGEEIFPHPANQAEGIVHGADAIRIGPEACYGCHREGSDEPPSCTECHTGWPHAEGFISGFVHGAGLTGKGGETARENCEICHAAESDTVAKATSPCNRCHASYPHADDWETSHGDRARASDAVGCASCHGADLGGKGDAPSCADCHTTWPHPDTWVADHPAVALADPTECADCHGANGEGGPTGVTCTRCHTGWPHADTWPSDHLNTAALAEGVCLTCHDAGDGPSTMPATCAPICHGGGS